MWNPRPWLAATLAVLAAPCARAQTLELDPDLTIQLAGSAAADDGGLWLDFDTQTGRMLFKVSEDLRVEHSRVLVLAPNSPRGILAFRAGLLGLRKEPRPPEASRIAGFTDSYRLVWIADDPAAAETTLYSWSSRDYPSTAFLAAAPDGSAIYLMPTSFQDPQLLKLAPDGTELWSRNLGPRRVSHIVATDDGIVALQGAPSADRLTRTLILAAWSANGEPLWEDEVVLAASSQTNEVKLLLPRTLAIVPQRNPEELQRLELIDLADRTARTVRIPSTYGRISLAPDGLLFSGMAFEHPLLAALDPVGDVRWMRRLQVLEGVRFAPAGDYYWLEVMPLGSNRIAMLVRYRNADGEERTEIVASDREGLQLTERFGRCVSADPLPIVERETEILRSYGISVRLGAWRPAETQAVDGSGCVLPSDSEYLRFLDEFSMELAQLGAVKLNQYEESIAVAVDAGDSPLRVTGFALSREISDVPGTVVSYGATAGAARLLAEEIVHVTQPRIEHVRAATREFSRLTGCSLSSDNRALDEPATDPGAAFLDTTESAIDLLAAEARRLPPELRARGRCFLAFNHIAFGTFDDLRPLSQAADTLRAALRLFNNQ